MPSKKKESNGSDGQKPIDAKAPSPGHAPDLKDEHLNENFPKESKRNGASAKKRKAETSTQSNKAPRRSARGGANAAADPVKMLNYLISPSSLDLCRPKDETEDLKARGENTRAYSTSSFTPFEELVCATVLSRPISHMLGLRSIRTIFNPPYGLTSPKRIREAGYERCREAFDTARTQHRQKTAEELVLVADAVVDYLGKGEDDMGLDRVREECGHDADAQRDMLKKHVKGFGKTGLEIFGRRIQGAWPEFYPFIDGKTSVAMERLGLPKDANELKELMEQHWEELEVKGVAAGDTEEEKRKTFVRILERAVGADLEGNTESIKADVA